MSEAQTDLFEGPTIELNVSGETAVGEIPRGWAATTIGDLCAYIQRGKSPKYIAKSELPVINQKCIRWDELQAEHVKFIDPVQWDKWAEERYLRKGDILWNSTGTGTIGRAFHCNVLPFRKCVVDSHVTILRCNPDIDSRFLYFFIRSPAVQSKIEDMQTGSTNQVELGKKVIEATPIPLAPLNEQRRIVSKIDELFSDIEAGERALKRARTALEPLSQVGPESHRYGRTYRRLARGKQRQTRARRQTLRSHPHRPPRSLGSRRTRQVQSQRQRT